ncbi:hypothetical protein HOU49_gp57 [Arthrobacter phage Eileen]|uniref:Uncharacterized protein n=1 Tax=Arthrobacter phage Eileen TaxID=2419956 RepID=A0A3G2KFR9_9CAUD|nr:hypothetical protein HOU49_gp57 [Arthrobacter phage Eileen]AYN57844.1 hypothetical protein PBI_EILEEN_57 [Arthrobacter phage Eileen]
MNQISDKLDQIEERINYCRTYNFGMAKADKLAHDDAPALVGEVRRLRKALAGHLFDGESLSTREAIRAELLKELQAEAWDRGFASGKSRAMRHMSDEPNLPLTAPNPYRDEEQDQLRRIPTYPNCATCEGGGCGDCA